jgi:TonB-dependent SusC/RagA subfamily outer membrane receptor
MRNFFCIFLMLTTWSVTTSGQNTPPWSAGCEGFGSAPPLIIIDGIPIESDSILRHADGNNAVTIKNGRKTFTITPQDIEKIEVLKLKAGSIGHSPDQCTILITTKKTKRKPKETSALTPAKAEPQPATRPENTKKVTGIVCHSAMPQPAGPLYVINGIPISADSLTNPLSQIPTASIQSITVLKDSNAFAIYGSSAIYGVVLIATKPLNKRRK